MARARGVSAMPEAMGSVATTSTGLLPVAEAREHRSSHTSLNRQLQTKHKESRH